MQLLRGGIQVTGQNSTAANRNEMNVKDPSQLGGSRYAQHALKGKEADISQKHNGLGPAKKGDKVEVQDNGDYVAIIRR